MRSIILSIVVFLTTSCAEFSEQKTSTGSITTSITTTSDRPNHIQISKKACNFDSTSFYKKMGVGIVEFEYGFPKTTAFLSKDLIDSIGFIFIENNELQIVYDSNSHTIPWFLYPTEYRSGSVIVTEIEEQAIKLNVEITNINLEFWIPRSKIYQSRSVINALDWKTFLSANTIWINEKVLENNPLRVQPSDTSDIVEFVYKYPIFQMNDFKLSWIEVSTLIHKSDLSKGSSDTMSQPLGWFKWYCNDSMQIQLPDFYQLEAFYFENK